jgi:hypothetical protein
MINRFCLPVLIWPRHPRHLRFQLRNSALTARLRSSSRREPALTLVEFPNRFEPAHQSSHQTLRPGKRRLPPKKAIFNGLFPALVQKLQLGVGNQPPQRPSLPERNFCRRVRTPWKTAAICIHELGQTYSLTVFHKPVIFNHMKRKATRTLPDLGQTAVWPNTC